ncbi:MAG: heavy metal translocating P-type ATPase [Chthoniobacterales bacterium]
MSSCCQCKATGVVETSAQDTIGWIRVAFAGLVAAQSMILGLAVNLSPPGEPSRTILHAILAVSAAGVFLLVGLPLLRAAFSAARHGRIVFEQLFLAGIFGAFAASLISTFTGKGHVYYEVVAVLLAIYTFGRILGERRRSAALDAAKKLGAEFDMCERISAAGITKVPVREIRPGDIVLVPAAAAISVDGAVVGGSALVNESALTGEPFPVSRRVGDTVFAGTHTLDGALQIRVTGASRQLDVILSRIAAAQSRPSHLQREADRLVAWFLPAVFAIAGITFALWTLRAGWTTGLFNALAVILVACPCSMGLATPIGVWSALAGLARRGVITSDSDLVERLAGIDAAVFDKTGTLGEEHLDIVDFVAAPDADRAALLAEVAALEAASNHPIARAFRKHASGIVAQDVRLLPGAGIAGHVGDAKLEIRNTPANGGDFSDQLRGNGPASHTLHILRDGAPAGAVLLREHLRDSARQVIASLEAAGIPCAVLTGDSGNAHGLPNTHTGLSSLEKIERMRGLGNKVLFVGDGINDAPAMAEAHASLCIAGGSAVAQQAAMGEIRDLGELPWAIARCRATVRAIRWNLLFAACYNFAGIALAAAGLLHPVAAALLMLASSFTVSWRALREPRITPLTAPDTVSIPVKLEIAQA